MTTPGLTASAVSALGEALFRAHLDHEPIRPLTDDHPQLSVLDAYRVQQDLTDRLVDAQGQRIVGYKLGLTSVPMQQMLGVTTPDFAPVLSSHVRASTDPVLRSDFISPKVEAEIALVLAADLEGPDCTPLDVARAVHGASSALEIVDSRIQDWRIKLADTIADLASCGAIVVGSSITPLAEVDLRLVGMVLTCNGGVVATGAGAAALGSPLVATAWLVNTLHAVGTSLRAGQVVMTGALHAAIDITPGQRYRADFDRLGPVGLTMT